jgi:hypothetical protein
MMILLAFACVKTTVQAQKTKMATPSNIQQEQDMCDFTTKKQECIGKYVQVKGLIPEMIHSHPILSSPSGIDAIQSYLDIGEQQIIILSQATWDCSGDVEVTGILKEVDMGGSEGTRGSYRNNYIVQSTIRCL